LFRTDIMESTATTIREKLKQWRIPAVSVCRGGEHHWEVWLIKLVNMLNITGTFVLIS